MNVNASATALYFLNNSYAELASVSKQLASGKSINSAADNPIAWSQAQSATNSANLWQSYADATNNSNMPELKTAASALTAITSLLSAMQKSGQDAQSNSGNAATDLAAMQQSGKSIQAIINAASANGVNLLNGSAGAAIQFTLGIGDQTTIDGNVSLSTVDLADKDGNGFLQKATDGTSTETNLLGLVTTDLTTNIANTLTNIQAAMDKVVSYSTNVGATQNAITTAASFATQMASTYHDLADSITAADTAKLAARETALQTQIQLSTQAMSIANSMGQYAIKLLG